MLKNFSTWLKSIFLTESAGNTYEYGCVMLFYKLPQIQEIHDKIDAADIYTSSGDNSFGLEEEPHITLLYGFHSDVDPDEVLDVCKKHKYPKLTLGNSSCFNNPEYDVLKFDVTGKVLHKVNAELSKFPHTTNFPDYHPHSTIGYIKKGKGQRYADLLNNKSYKVTPEKLVYSLPNGDRREVML
jgi:2'-5' RNA ligase